VLHAAQGPCNPRAHALQSARCYTGCRCMGVASTTGATCTSAGRDTIAGMALSACAAATASVILLIYARSQVAYTDVYLTCLFRETATEPCCNGALQTDWVRGCTSAKRQVWSADMAARALGDQVIARLDWATHTTAVRGCASGVIHHVCQPRIAREASSTARLSKLCSSSCTRLKLLHCVQWSVGTCGPTLSDARANLTDGHPMRVASTRNLHSTRSECLASGF